MRSSTAPNIDPAYSIVGAAANQGRCHRASGVKQIAPGGRRDVNGWEGRTACNAEPVDPAIRTTHLGHRMVECVELTGTRSAEGIMASGHVNRTNRPNTWLLRPLLHA